jgi:hypothetical protein
MLDTKLIPFELAYWRMPDLTGWWSGIMPEPKRFSATAYG